MIFFEDYFIFYDYIAQAKCSETQTSIEALMA